MLFLINKFEAFGDDDTNLHSRGIFRICKKGYRSLFNKNQKFTKLHVIKNEEKETKEEIK